MTTTAELRFALYRLYDADRQPLYFGIGRSPLARWSEHKRWPLVAHIDIEWFPDEASAKAGEKAAIRSARPPYNTVHNGPEITVEERPHWPRRDILAYLREAILDGRIPHDTQLPSYARLAEAFSVSVSSIQIVIGLLQDSGLVEGVRGRGNYVTSSHLSTVEQATEEAS